MCHYFVRIKLASVIISRWCDSHEKYPHIHLPAHVHTRPHTHITRTHTHTRVCSPSELLTFSSRLIAIDICLLSWACSRVGADGNGWCYCWRRKREGRKKEEGGGVGGGGLVWKEEDQGRQAHHAAPGNPSGPPAHQKGHRATQPYILITKEPSLWPETVGYNMALLLCHPSCHLPSLSTVIMEETCRM